MSIYVNDLPSGGGSGGGGGGGATLAANTFTGIQTIQNQLQVTAAAGVVAQYIQAANSQTADLLRFLASDGSTVMAKVDKVGNFTAPTFVGIPVNPMIATPKTATYQILVTDSVIEYNNTGAFTTTMADPTLCKGQAFVLINVGTGTALITIAAKGSETFGAQAYTALHMSTAGESWTLMSDGTNWLILAHYATTAPATYTLTLGSTGATPPTKGTVVVDKVLWWREGKNLRMQYNYQQSAGGTQGTTGSVIKYPLPAGYSADTSLHPVSTTNFQFIGAAYAFYPSVITGAIAASLATATDVCLWTGNTIVTTNNLTYNSAGTFVLGFDVTIPIANWEP